MTKNIKKLVFSTLIAIVCLFVGWFMFYFYQTNAGISSEVAAQKTISFINENFLAEGSEASLISVVDNGSAYEIVMDIAGTEYTSYSSKDGKFLFPEGYEMIDANESENSGEISKRDIPDVKLFIMSYCPYGLQLQKAYLPVYELLKGEADMGVYFVNYIMHEKTEIDENLTQYCIQKDNKDKYYDYLNCFVASGNTDACQISVEINKEKLNNCITETDSEFGITEAYNDKSTWLSGAYPAFNIHKDLNDTYGVQGSPTLVINDEVVNLSSRSPEALKQIVCDAFDTAPEACSQTLSTEVSSTGIGVGTGSNSSGSCE